MTLAAIEADWRSANLDNRTTTMLEFVERLTKTPKLMQRQHIEALRQVGFNDADILAIVEVTSYYAYVNRIADGLGVVLEDE